MQKPRLKSVFVPLPQGEGVIRIGANDYGLASEIQDDEQGHVWHLMHLLNGQRTRLEIVAAMQAFDPAVTAAEVDEVIMALFDAGYLEDGGVTPFTAGFSLAEAARYQRNFDFFSYFHLPPHNQYDFQARLKAAKVVILGVGGLGSYVALSLAAVGVGHLLLVDDDRVEPSNLNRQVLYTERNLGQLKVEAAADRLREVNPHVEIRTWNKRISSVADVQTCLADQNLLICAADRPRIRIYEWVNAAAEIERVPWIRGANDGLTVNTAFHVPGETACFECGHLYARARHPWYQRVLDYVMEQVGDRTVNPCISPVAGLIGHLTAFEAVKYLAGVAKPVMYNGKLTVDLQTFETFFVPFAERHPNCSVCGERMGARGEGEEWRVAP